MNDKQWSQIVAKAWADPKFKQRLVADPAAALKEGGMDVPAGVTIKVIENTDKVCYLTLPAKPSGELSDEELEKVAGGGFFIQGGDVRIVDGARQKDQLEVVPRPR